jgi:hypothetical protein
VTIGDQADPSATGVIRVFLLRASHPVDTVAVMKTHATVSGAFVSPITRSASLTSLPGAKPPQAARQHEDRTYGYALSSWKQVTGSTRVVGREG